MKLLKKIEGFITRRGSKRNVPKDASLESMPKKLKLKIFNYISSPKQTDLHALALTSHIMNESVTPSLYQIYKQKDNNPDNIRVFLKSLLKNPSNQTHVRTLAVYLAPPNGNPFKWASQLPAIGRILEAASIHDELRTKKAIRSAFKWNARLFDMPIAVLLSILPNLTSVYINLGAEESSPLTESLVFNSLGAHARAEAAGSRAAIETLRYVRSVEFGLAGTSLKQMVELEEVRPSVLCKGAFHLTMLSRLSLRSLSH